MAILMNFSFVVSLFFRFALGKINDERGQSFTDNFETFNSKIWHPSPHHVICSPKECVLFSKANILFYDTNSKNRETYLQMINSCEGPHCCAGEKQHHTTYGRCAKFTSAELNSNHFYRYGRLTWYGVPGHTTQGNMGAWSCIALERHSESPSGTHHLGMSMCFSSKNDQLISMSVMYGREIWKHNHFMLPRDGHLTQKYEIEWRPEEVKFFIDGLQIGHAKDPEQMIPDGAVRISVLLWPLPHKHQKEEDVSEPSDEPSISVVHISQISFEKFDIEHVELFKRQESSQNKVILWGLFLLLFIVFTIVHVFYCDQDHEKDSHMGTYHLISNELQI